MCGLLSASGLACCGLAGGVGKTWSATTDGWRRCRLSLGGLRLFVMATVGLASWAVAGSRRRGGWWKSSRPRRERARKMQGEDRRLAPITRRCGVKNPGETVMGSLLRIAQRGARCRTSVPGAGSPGRPRTRVAWAMREPAARQPHARCSSRAGASGVATDSLAFVAMQKRARLQTNSLRTAPTWSPPCRAAARRGWSCGTGST
jgi:hypothetical protein